MSPWDRLLQQPQRRGHFVQLYDTDGPSLTRNVSQYLGEGLRRGDSVLVIATPEHRDLFSRRLDELDIRIQARLWDSQLLFLDAPDTLTGFMVGGQPQWDRFEQSLRRAMRQLRVPEDGAGFRAYGEMVGILWKARQFSTAVRLEQFWNKLLAGSSFSLYCSYAIDVFGKDFHPDAVDALLSAHTHLVPAACDGKLELAFDRALHETLGPDAGDLRHLIRATHRPSWAVMPDAESMILWIRKTLPNQADEILERARAQYLRAVGDGRRPDEPRASNRVRSDGSSAHS